MSRVKSFYVAPHEMENEINKWLVENENATLLDIKVLPVSHMTDGEQNYDATYNRTKTNVEKVFVMLVYQQQGEDNYVTAKKSPAEQLTSGETLVFGNYKKPIIWDVLDKKDGKVLVISRYGLDYQKFDRAYHGDNWEDSTIREWLNGEFLKSAFTDDECEQIQVASTSDHLKDKVFLLSADEVNQYLTTETSRKCIHIDKSSFVNTDAIDQALVDANAWSWWLRGGSYLNYNYIYMDKYGKVRGDDNCEMHYLVRPAMWVKMDDETSGHN